MEKVYIISDDTKLFELMNNVSKYGEFFDQLSFINEQNSVNIMDRNKCVIIAKDDYELDVLRLLAKKMYVILCTGDKELKIEIEDENNLFVVSRPYRIDELYCCLKNILKYSNLESKMEKRMIKEIDARKVAETDYLTGLPNRRGLYEHFELNKKGKTVHCMFLDIDNFKKVNDTYGHKIGDKLLIKVSHMVKEKIGNAFLARMGGDEYAVMIEGSASREQVVLIAEDILKSVDDIEMSMDINSIISFSIGIIFDQPVSQDLDDILLKCDIAMYQAKKSGKGRYIIYNSIEDQFTYKLSVLREKNAALAAGQFKIYFQPRMNMVTSGIECTEVKIWWDHPKDGLRHHSMFMEILEEDGFVVDLEMYIFEQLCKIMKTWNNTSLEKLPVFMNISRKHFLVGNIVDQLQKMVEMYDLKPERFIIGINDLDTSEKATATVKKLKKTGYSISYKKSIGNIGVSLLDINDNLADQWVIDTELTKSMLNSRSSATMIKTIISLARELNIKIVARGIEDKKSVEYLSGYGCNIGVGKYFSEPIKPKEFVEFAIANIYEENNTYIYDFDGTLEERTGKNKGRYVGNECLFEYCEELDKQVIRFVGGAVLQNVVELPIDVMRTQNYTVSIMLNVEEFSYWTSVFYTEYSNGFMSVMPFAWDGIVMLRVKDLLYEDEWHDAIGHSIELKQWYYITATYNSRKSESRVYVNGELFAYRDDVHTIESPTRVVVGGDTFMDSFTGRISQVAIHDYVLSVDNIREEYKKNFEKLDRDKM